MMKHETHDVGLPNALRKLVRLHVADATSTDTIVLDEAQSHYLANVMRKKVGDALLAFNADMGEWRANITSITKKSVSIQCIERTRITPKSADVWYAFAPLKSARLDYLIQKATELGCSTLIPVITQRTQVSRIKSERLTANAIEAAEQCGLIHVPDVLPEIPLQKFLTSIDQNRVLIFLDEHAPCTSPLHALSTLKKGTPCAVLIGPEGGFDEVERTLILRQPNVIALSLGVRVVRADTAAVMALTLVQSTIGDIATIGDTQ